MLRTPIFALMLILTLALASMQAQAQLAVSAGIEYLKWEEDTTPAVTETGPLLSLGLEYTWNQPEGFVFGYRGRFYTGDVDYDGALLFSGTPVKSTTSYLGIHRGRNDADFLNEVGPRVHHGKCAMVVPAVGDDKSVSRRIHSAKPPAGKITVFSGSPTVGRACAGRRHEQIHHTAAPQGKLAYSVFRKHRAHRG